MRLVALGPAALAAGLAHGQPLAEARAVAPGLIAYPADPAGEAGDLAALAEWLTRYAPLAGIVRMPNETDPHGVFLDVTGCARLAGGEARLLEKMCARLEGFGLAVRGAIAGTPGAAAALARFSAPGAILPPGGERAGLAPLPVEGLRLTRETADGLARLGQIMALPRAPLAARFGGDLLDRLDAALGTRAEPIDAVAPTPQFRAEIALAEPILEAPAILACLERLTRALERRLTRAGQGGRVFILRLYRVDGGRAALRVATARPERRPERLMRLFRDRLEAAHDARAAGFGYDLVRLEAHEPGPIEAEAPGLFDPDTDETGAGALADRLANRLGPTRVLALRLENAHAPERSAGLVPLAAAPAPEGPADSRADWRAERATARPVRILPRPEPIEAVACVPDGAPARFRWRGLAYHAARASGPERIAGDWRRAAGERTRDYYRVEDEAGRRFWIFREGLYGESGEPRWFLHGFFG
jgi:protein ImuB